MQPGRRMTVLNGAKQGVSIPLALMSPHVRGLEGSENEREQVFEKRARVQEEELRQRAQQPSARL